MRGKAGAMLRAAVSAAACRGWRFASPVAPGQSAAFARRLCSGDTSEIDPNLDLYKVGPRPARYFRYCALA